MAGPVQEKGVLLCVDDEIIVLTAHGSVDTAVAAVVAGGWWIVVNRLPPADRESRRAPLPASAAAAPTSALAIASASPHPAVAVTRARAKAATRRRESLRESAVFLSMGFPVGDGCGRCRATGATIGIRPPRVLNETNAILGRIG